MACASDVDPATLADMVFYWLNFDHFSALSLLSIKFAAQQTDGFSGAECVALCQEAAMGAMQEDVHATEVRITLL